MSEWIEWFGRFPLMKWVVILGFALLGAAMQRDMTFVGRGLTVVAGVGAAVVFAEPIRHFLDLEMVYGNAVAAVLALTGRNWAAFAIRASKDPTKTMQDILAIWRGKPKG